MKTFLEYYESMSYEDLNKLAESAGTSSQYLYQLATGRRRPGADIIERLMRADKKITFEMMRS